MAGPTREEGGKSAADIDRISNLPGEVKSKILCHLPIKEAARTSILASKWRYAWNSIPKLVLADSDCVSSSTGGNTRRHSGLVKLVDIVLLVHSGAISTFDLSSERLCHGAFDRWMLILARNGIMGLKVRFTCVEKSKIPSTLFSCFGLEDLEMYGCVMKLPQMFNGFKLLHTLKLEKCSVNGADVQKLVSSCSLLRGLTLWDLEDCISLKINAPALQRLDISTSFRDLHLEAPHLVCATIEMPTTPDKSFPEEFSCGNHLVQALGFLPDIKELSLFDHTLSHLADGPVPEKLPTPYRQLKRMFLTFPEDEDEAAVVLCLLQNAPNLQLLQLSLSSKESPSSDTSSFWESTACNGFMFKHLHTANIHFFVGSESVLAFVKFVLRCAPTLSKMNLRKVEGHEHDPKILRKLLQFPRASKRAEVFV